MMKLFRKSEITFAILWIVIYVVGMGTLRNLGDDSPWMTLGLIAVCAALLLILGRNGLTGYYGLKGWAKNSRALWWFLPLWVLASLNLWGGVSVKFPWPGQLFAVVSMALVGVAEELIFRGLLFRAMLKTGKPRTAIIVSSVTFGLGHILNLLTGHDLLPTLTQVVFAVAVGFMMTMAFYKGGSLLPCILSHSLVDVFSLFARSDAPQWLNWTAHGVTLALALCYCLYLAKRVETAPLFRRGAEQAA